VDRVNVGDAVRTQALGVGDVDDGPLGGREVEDRAPEDFRAEVVEQGERCSLSP